MADLLGLSSHQREKWWQQLKEAESFVPTSKSTHCCTGSEAGQKSHHVLPYLSLPAALAALQMPTLHQVRLADASRSMPTCFSHLGPLILFPGIRLIV